MLTPNVERWRDAGGFEQVAGRRLDVQRRATTAVLDGLRELRPGVPVRELPGIGHYPQRERPDLIAAALDAALARG
jgi:pimeloyl-ACP methyl ester carboxylesterase